MNIFRKKITIGSLAVNLTSVLGLVMIWRGMWYVLDAVDEVLFGTHIWSALGGIFFGLVVLYLPDKDLKEIEKL